MSGLDCNELVELVTAFLDDAVDKETRARFTEHLDLCEGCDRYLQLYRETIDTMGHLRSEHLSRPLASGSADAVPPRVRGLRSPSV